MTAYYNEHDTYAADWLRNLIDAGHIARGVVDDRSVEDVRPSDIAGFTQCHFFAGIGVWSYALRLAGWSDDRPVWTGSCPCQPFSAAGQGAGFADERHLWPAWHHLIRECRPPVVFGEQVASKDADPWIDLVHDDMEALGYAFGAVPFPAAGVGAPHIRERAYFVADTNQGRLRQPGRQRGAQGRQGSERHGIVGNTTGGGWRQSGRDLDWRDAPGPGPKEKPELRDAGTPGATNGFWADAAWIDCRDTRARPVEPGTFPLAHGAPARVGRLRAFGNAICAPAAEAFIRSYLDAANG